MISVSTVAELLADLAAAPQSPGARCRDEWQLFDTASAGRTLPRIQDRGAAATRAGLVEMPTGTLGFFSPSPETRG